MKEKLLSLIIICSMTVWVASCGGSEKTDDSKTQATTVAVDPMENWKNNNGVGPIKSLELPESIDQAMVTSGNQIFDAKCTACHKIEKNFIGPSPKGILSRRTAAWTMNMILNPDVMVVEDPLAKKLMMQFNGAPMANQNLTEEEARQVLEYFRTL
jgi:mono/diheme cytochrome c family protein